MCVGGEYGSFSSILSRCCITKSRKLIASTTMPGNQARPPDPGHSSRAMEYTTTPNTTRFSCRPNLPSGRASDGAAGGPNLSAEGFSTTVVLPSTGESMGGIIHQPEVRRKANGHRRRGRGQSQGLCLLRAKERHARFGDTCDVPNVRATAAAHHVEPRHPARQADVVGPEFGRIAAVEFRGIVQLGVALLRRVRPNG